jgi:hypothetical protein
MLIPQGFEKWNRALHGAYRKGWLAGSEGFSNLSPYDDKRKYDGRLTWSRAFVRAWSDGWEAGRREAK